MERFKLTWKKTHMILVSYLKQGVLLQLLVAEKSSSNSFKHFVCQNFHRKKKKNSKWINRFFYSLAPEASLYLITVSPKRIVAADCDLKKKKFHAN